MRVSFPVSAFGNRFGTTALEKAVCFALVTLACAPLFGAQQPQNATEGAELHSATSEQDLQARVRVLGHDVLIPGEVHQPVVVGEDGLGPRAEDGDL